MKNKIWQNKKNENEKVKKSRWKVEGWNVRASFYNLQNTAGIIIGFIPPVKMLTFFFSLSSLYSFFYKLYRG